MNHRICAFLCALALVGCAMEPAPPRTTRRAGLLVEARVAALQYGAGGSGTTTVDGTCASAAEPDVCAVRALVAQAQAKGAKLVVAPEYGLGQSYLEPDPKVGENPGVDAGWPADAFITIFSKQAKALGIYLVINLQTYSGQKPSRSVYNTQVAFGPDGAIVAKHHKFELFGNEANSLTPGRSVSVFDTPFGKVGLLICADMYGDLRLHDKLTRQLGARIVAVSSLWTAGGGVNWPANFAKNWDVYVVSSNTTDGTGRGGGVFAPTGKALQKHDGAAPAITYGIIAADE